MRSWPTFQLPLSGSRVGRLGDGSYLQLLLSTPSLGITKYVVDNFVDDMRHDDLSTPSLGITCQCIAMSGRMTPTFNSLSRDHLKRAPDAKGPRENAFNSLSRDHDGEYLLFRGAQQIRDFQLPLSGSHNAYV